MLNKITVNWIQCMKSIIPNEEKKQIAVLETVRSDERNWRWHKQKDAVCSWVGRINIAKMYYPRQPTVSMHIQIPMAFFTELENKF